MILLSLLSFAFCLCLVAIQAFVARSVIRRPTPLKRLLVYAAAAAAVHLALQPCPFLVPSVLLETAAQLALQVRVFKAPLFPDAVIGVAFPLSLGFSAHLILLPLISWLLETDLSSNAQRFLFFLPSFVLAFRYWLRKMLSDEDSAPQETVGRDIHLIAIIVGASFLLHVRAILNLTNRNENAPLLSTAYALAGTVLAPIVAATLLLQLRKTELERRKAEYHALKHRLQSSALQTLREERHDFLNKLSLISTYLQMGEWQKAQHCVDFAAASLSQEGDDPSLPEDAWLTELEAKKQKAAEHDIEFTINIKAEPPLACAEQRLLPKLISNLVDNAFTAVDTVSKPQVTLLWDEQAGQRILQVSNNGPPITSAEGKRIFQPGVTTKDNVAGTHGWGLVICRKIAAELKGTLSYKSNMHETSFTLKLPPAGITDEEQARPHP